MAVSRSLGNLIVRLVAEGLGGYKADMNAAADVTKDAANKIETSTSKAGKAAQVMGGQIGASATQVEALGAVAGAAGLGVTALAAGIAVAGYAAFQGSKENQDYVKALAMTGNAAGVTTGQLADMAKNISGTVGTTGQASAALVAMAATGQVAGSSLQKYAQIAVESQKLTGQSVEDTAKMFAKLGQEPVSASLALNASMNYLTASTFAQIKAAADLGDKTTAGQIAQDAAAAATDANNKKIAASLGTLQIVWKSVGEAASKAWDKMMNLGREQGPEQALAAQRVTVQNLEAQLARGGLGTSGTEKQLSAARETLGAMQENVRLGQRSAENTARQAESEKAKITWMQEGDKYLSKEAKLTKEIDRIRTEGNAAGATAKEIKDRIDAATEKGVKSGGRGGASAAANDETNAKIEALKRGQAQEEILTKQSVDRINSERRRGMVSDVDAIDQIAAAEMKAINSAIANFEAEKVIVAGKKNSKKEVAALDGQIAAAKEKLHGRELAQGYALLDLEFKTQAARQAFYNSADQANLVQLDALRDKNKAMREELEAIGLTTTQLFNLSLARRDDAIAAQQQKIAAMKVFGDGQSAAAIQLEIDKLAELQTARGLAVQIQDKKELSLELKGFDATAAQLESLANITGKMGDGFKRATSALGGFSNAFKTLAAAEKNEKLNADERTRAQIGGYGDMAGAAAEFFEENSAGYEIMKAAEQGFRAFELAMSVQSMVQKTVEATTKVAANGTIAASGVMAGAGEMFASLGPFGFPAVAAMLAVMASLGFGGGGSSSSFGTAGAGNQIGADGRKATSTSPADNEPTNYDPATGAYTKQNKPQKTEQEMIDFANAAAIDAAANAVANLRIEAMKLTAGSEELELSLARARLAAGGMGKAQHELATQGMSEAEIASYNYNQALKGQISVQMDIANGTSLTSDNMKKLAGESRSLAIELMMASGDISGARAMQRDDDTAGYTASEVAVYDHNAAMRDQIDAMNAGASAAREAAQAEQQLAADRAAIAGNLNVLLGRTTQIQFDRATALAATTDAASIAMLTLTYQLEDMYSAVDANYAKLERSIAAEKKLVDVRLKSATDLATALKTTRDAISSTLDRASAQAQIAMYVALAKAGGVLPTAAALKPALDSIAKPSMDLFKTFSEYAIDQARTANDISDLANYADKQVSVEQQTIDRLDSQLDTAKQALDVMKGIDNSVTSVASAVTAFQFSMEALAAAKSTAGSYNYASPMTGGGGGGGYSGGGAAGAAAGGAYEAIAGQDNADIVSAYRTYYSRNPDASGYDYFNKSNLAGDALMQAILRASSGDANGADYQKAIANGYDPTNPVAKYLKSKNKSSAATVEDFGSFANGGDHAGGLRLVGERGPELEATGPSRITNTESLMSMLKNGGNNDVLVAEIRALRAEVAGLQKAADKTATNTGKTEETFRRMTDDGMSLKVKVTA